MKKIKDKPDNLKVYAAHKYVEIVADGSMKADYISYDDRNSEARLRRSLK